MQSQRNSGGAQGVYVKLKLTLPGDNCLLVKQPSRKWRLPGTQVLEGKDPAATARLYLANELGLADCTETLSLIRETVQPYGTTHNIFHVFRGMTRIDPRRFPLRGLNEDLELHAVLRGRLAQYISYSDIKLLK